MAAYLKHIETGEILPFNHDLATDSNMVPCDINGNESPEPEVADDPGNAPPKSRKTKKSEPDEFLSGIDL